MSARLERNGGGAGMTHLERVMCAIKFDTEILTGEQAENLKGECQSTIVSSFCPKDFILGGATLNTCHSNEEYECESEALTCWDCWNQEVNK